MSNAKKAAYIPMIDERRRKKRNVIREEKNDSNKMIEELVEKLEEKQASETLQSAEPEQMVEEILDEFETFQRVKIYSSSSSISLIDDSYSIMSKVNDVLHYMKQPENVLEPDDTAPLFEGSYILKGEWAREYYSICNKHILSIKVQEEILNLLL
jgi:hypothetical protein